MKINAMMKSQQIMFTIGGSRISQTGGADPWVWGKNLLHDKIIVENWMKIKEIGWRYVLVPSPFLYLPMLTSFQLCCLQVLLQCLLKIIDRLLSFRWSDQNQKIFISEK